MISAKTHAQGSDYNIFEGTKVSGTPEFVIVKGKVCYEDEKIRVAEGFGQCLELPSHSPELYGHRNGNGGGDHVDALEEQLDRFQVEFEDRDYVPERADSVKSNSTQVTHTSRAPRPEGQRDLQSSSFSISKGERLNFLKSYIIFIIIFFQKFAMIQPRVASEFAILLVALPKVSGKSSNHRQAC